MDQRFLNLPIGEPILERRIGKEWFKDLPEQAGVYTFRDSLGKIIYVGKAKNLKKRLYQYKSAKGGKVHGKQARLISKVAEIEIEKTTTEEDAFLLENRLIREYQPIFNHVNKNFETYYYICFEPVIEGIFYEISMKLDDNRDKENWFGCFKGHLIVRRSIGSLLRLIWLIENSTSDPFKLPVLLTRNLTPRRFLMVSKRQKVTDNVFLEHLNNFMSGESCELLTWLAIHFDDLQKVERHPFQNRYFEIHLEYLKKFYDRKLKPHRLLRNGHNLLMQDELDDAVVRFQNHQKVIM